MTYADTGVSEMEVAQAPDEEKLKAYLASVGMQWFHRAQDQRSTQERQWYLNLAFYYGEQFVKFRQVNGAFDLYTPRAPYWTVRIVVNQIRKIVRKEISRLTAQKPNAFVVPASTEDADVFAAQAGEQIWDSLWRELEFNRILREAIFWQATCGNGYLKSYWDPTQKDPNASLEPSMDSETANAGYGVICVEPISPFHLFVPDLTCSSIEKQPYLIHAQVRPNSWIKQTFGIDIITDKLSSVDDSLLNAQKVTRNNNKKDQSIILEVWVKPGYLPELPEGGMFIIAGEQTVYLFNKWPYDNGKYPFAKLDGMPTGKFYAASIVEDLIPLQRELNRSRGQLIESKNRMSKPQLVAEEGAVDAKRITTEPGLVIPYKVGFQPPQPLPLQNLPSYVTDEINRLYDDMADISGQHEVSNGSTPPGVTAATAISFLQEQDESLIAGHFTSLEEAIEKTAAQCLTFVKMYWDEARTVKVAGVEGTFDVRTFKNSDLRGNADIRVESGSALPTSRAAKQAFVMDLMKMGFIPPDEGLEILEVGGLAKIYERVQIDKRQAQRENLRMRVVTEEDMAKYQEQWQQENPEVTKDINSGLSLEAPLLIPVNTYDNHALHIEVHNNYRKGQGFESAPQVTKILFEEHVRQHQEAMIGQMTHPLSGMDPSNPNALPPEVEDAAMQDQQQEQGTSGPVPMPSLDGEQPQEGVIA